MRFTKMEGCGNDYIYINGFEEEVKYPDMLAVAMSERHFGVGADGLVLILPSEVADFRMRMFNMDGSEAVSYTHLNRQSSGTGQRRSTAALRRNHCTGYRNCI